MKITIFFLALFHSVFLIDQEQETPQYNLHSKMLCMGDAMHLENRTIKFKKIISDSRCPRGVTCIWAGEVKVLVEFYENGKLKGEKIVTGSNVMMNENEIVSSKDISLSEFFDVENLKISSVAVYPYPEAKHKISAEEYSVTLKVSEKIKAD